MYGRWLLAALYPYIGQVVLSRRLAASELVPSMGRELEQCAIGKTNLNAYTAALCLEEKVIDAQI